MRFRVLLLTGVLLLASLVGVPEVQAADYVVATVPMAIGHGTADVADTVFELLDFCPPIPDPLDDCPTKPWQQNMLFIFSEDDVGSTIWIGPENPYFAASIAELTNGAQGYFDRVHGVMIDGTPNRGGGYEGTEDVFFGDQAGSNGFDLSGYVITRIGLQLTAVTIDSPGSDPNGDGNWTDVSGTGNWLFEVDGTPPALTLPAGVVEEATGPSGATVNYAVSATDNVDPAPVVVCAPASGSVFPLGSTTVGCTATDAAGLSTVGSFTVDVVDTTPPVMTVPPNITVDATSPSGALVTYAATATDSVDPNPQVVCDKTSPYLFPLGDTVVACTATDQAGNTHTLPFTVTVNVSSGTFDGFEDDIEGFGLPNGISNSFIKKIDNAEASWLKGDTTGACEKLASLINEVNAQDGKKLTSSQASEIRNAATTLGAAIGCSIP